MSDETHGKVEDAQVQIARLREEVEALMKDYSEAPPSKADELMSERLAALEAARDQIRDQVIAAVGEGVSGEQFSAYVKAEEALNLAREEASPRFRARLKALNIDSESVAQQEFDQIIARLDVGIPEAQKSMDALLARLRTTRIAA